jgi:phosphoribosylanthranilate isomerase
MLKLKVCGMRDSQNIAELIKLSPDFIGFIFHEESARNITHFPEIKIPSHIHKAGVFVNKDVEFILQKAETHQLDYVQLHGKETPSFCNEVKEKNIKIIKAFNIHEDFDFEQLGAYEGLCDYFLFDAFGRNAGGNSITFNWQLLDKYRGDTPFLLSGGIDGSMAKTIKAIKHPHLMGIDINSGFEIEAGLKDIQKIKAFKDEL